MQLYPPVKPGRLILLALILLLTACASPQASPQANPAPAFETLAVTRQPTASATRTATRAASATPQAPGKTLGQAAVASTDEPTRPTPSTTAAPTRPTLRPDQWKTLPVIPPISDRVAAIYQQGLALGNNPNAFSKIGDCGSTPAWFLGDFDRGPEFYDLGPYTGLQEVIEHFHGSFGRTSLAARSGFNASALFAPLWSDRAYCQASETPLACEYRNQRPSLVFVMLGTNDVWRPEEFEPQMRKIIEYSLHNGVIPILSTKADNQEKDFRINATIARLAFEYDLPLWNFWAAAQPLPDGGLQEDGAHLTWGRNFFADEEAMQHAWPWRNLGALQMLDAIWRKTQE